MNNRNIFFIYFFVLLYGANIACSFGPFSALFDFNKLDQDNTLDIRLEKEIEALQKRKAEQDELSPFYKSELEHEQSSLLNLKEKAKTATTNDQEFVNEQIVIANQIVQVLVEVDQINQQIISIIDAHIKLVQEYKQDPEFKNKNLLLPSKSLYSIEDLQKISSSLFHYEDEIKNLQDRLKRVTVDLDNRKKTQALSRQEYEEKKKEQLELKNRDTVKALDKVSSKFTLEQQAEILDTQEKLLLYKKELADLRVKEVDQRAHFIEEQIKVLNLQMDVVSKEYDRIKQELHVTEKDIDKFDNALKQQIQESLKHQTEYTSKIEGLEILKSNELNRLLTYKQKHNISEAEIENISNWTFHPSDINKWGALVDIGRIKNNVSYGIDINKEYLLAQIDLEKTKTNEEQLNVLIVTSWYKLTQGKFGNIFQDDIVKEIKQYEKIKADIQVHISSLSDKRANAANELNSNARIAENIKEVIKLFRSQKDSIFKGRASEYNRYAVQLKDELSEIHQRGEIIAQLIELYTNISTMQTQEIKKIDAMLDILKSKSQWRTSPPLWKGLQNFIPDIKRFIKYLTSKDIRQSIAVNQQTFSELFQEYTQNASGIIALLLQAIIIILLYLLIKLYLPDIKNLLSSISPQFGIGHIISSFGISTITFINQHLLGIFVWSILFISIRYHVIKDTYTGVIFYLLSILYWELQAYRFIRYLAQENVERGYIFSSKQYQRRFFTVFSIFLYATIAITLFREAFIWAKFARSDAPTILIVINFILLQISVISIIGREQILNLIPRTTPLWEWVYDHVKKYYYFFLAGTIFVIIMSNPYVGYGPQFFYIVTRVLLILLLIPFFTALHARLKRMSGSLFFYSDGEVIKERFAYGRTLYGIFVILSFLFFVTLAFIIAARIWGYEIDISYWLHKEIYPYTDPDTRRKIVVNAISLLKVLLYVFSGITAAHIINKYLLGRMFDLLLVNIGIQNAILTFTRYIIILAAIIIGLQSIGLHSSIYLFFAVLGGLGVAGKEFISDFIGYFVILIQRPIKIGDLIRIDGEVSGIVRHVTLRSVVLRRKNSVTVIIPNSHVMSKPVVNWSYSRTFFAFDDILLTVPYNTDPIHVRGLILKVLHSNINILKNPAPIVWLNEFTENGFQFLVRCFLSPDKVLDQWEIASDIRLEIVKLLKSENIEVASPTRILRVIQGRPTEINPPEL